MQLAIRASENVPPELLKLVLDKLQEDYDAQQAARRQVEAGDVPASEQTIDMRPEARVQS